MNDFEKNIVELFLKYKSEKIFIDKLKNALQKKIGCKLFTLTVMHPNDKFVTRVYSSNVKIYPVGGKKKIPNNYWADVTIKQKKSFIGNNKKQIQKYFSDYRIITDLGCESILNQVVIFNNKTIGTMNLLDVENHFNKKDLNITGFVSNFLTSIYLNHQIKVRKK